jgi:hypothetical protein
MRNQGSAQPPAHAQWKNTGVLWLGFNPNQYIEEKETRKTKRPTYVVLVKHNEEPSSAG